MGTAKHALRLENGKTMLEAVAEPLRHVCDALAIVGLRDPQHALDARQRFPNAALIHDQRRGEPHGPLAGIEALLATNLCDAYIVCSCDTPLLSPALMEALAQPCAAPTAVLRLEGEEYARPLPCRVHASALKFVTKLLEEGHNAVHELHRTVGAKEIHGPAFWAAALSDVNTPSDLARVNALLASTPAPPDENRSAPLTEVVRRQPGVQPRPSL